MAIILFFAAVLGLPAIVLLCSGYGKKRGCGRGCASCGSRHICHPGQYGSVRRPPPDG